TLLKLTCPGVPDLLQGAELWDLSLVDPDNRRSVDFERRRELLSVGGRATSDPQTRASFVRALLAVPEDGRVKLYLTWKALRLRAALPELFSRGDYLPLKPAGSKRENIVAFARRYGER